MVRSLPPASKLLLRPAPVGFGGGAEEKDLWLPEDGGCDEDDGAMVAAETGAGSGPTGGC